VVAGARFAVAVEESCSPAEHIIYRRWTKNAYDGEGEPPQSYLDAWDEVEYDYSATHDGVIVFQQTDYSDGTFEGTPACLVPDVEELWTPGQFANNPGTATYTLAEESDEGGDIPIAGVPSIDGALRGGFDFPISFVNSSLNETQTRGTYSRAEHRWEIDLSDWPEEGGWPPGFTISGRLIWEESEARDGEETSRDQFSEDYFIDESNRVWIGDVHDFRPAVAGIGENVIRRIELIQGFTILLPFP
jgi:hypothetical protein